MKPKVSPKKLKPSKHSHRNSMDKVKIKRVKRGKKEITTKEKVLAGLGLGATLLGGAAAVSAQPETTEFVKAQTTEEGSATKKAKGLLTDVFGVGTAHAAGLSGKALSPNKIPSFITGPAKYYKQSDIVTSDSSDDSDVEGVDSGDVVTPNIVTPNVVTPTSDDSDVEGVDSGAVVTPPANDDSDVEGVDSGDVVTPNIVTPNVVTPTSDDSDVEGTDSGDVVTPNIVTPNVVTPTSDDSDVEGVDSGAVVTPPANDDSDVEGVDSGAVVTPPANDDSDVEGVDSGAVVTPPANDDSDVEGVDSQASQPVQGYAGVESMADVSGLQMPAGYLASSGSPLDVQAPDAEVEDLAGAADVAAEGSLGNYTVKGGDNLWNIAKKYYGDGRKWRVILAANPNCLSRPGDTHTLKIGAQLVIPKI